MFTVRLLRASMLAQEALIFSESSFIARMVCSTTCLPSFGIVCEGQHRRFVEALLALAAVGPDHQADEGDHDHHGAQSTQSPDIHHTHRLLLIEVPRP